MSKAFTRESDDAPDLPAPRALSSLPAGAKNYVTPGGLQRMRDELDQLVSVERPRLAALPDENERQQQIRALDQRVQQLQQSLLSAVAVPPPALPWDQVRFGATVTVRNRRGEESRYRIVGVDETDLDRDWVSWVSPIAKALLNARVGGRVRFKFPSGEEELEIVRLEYEEGG